MMAALQTATGPSVLMVGHNPGIAAFATDLLAEAPDHPRFDDYPTSATLVARFDVEDWAALRCGTGKAAAFAIPADLM
jgi:phosphohistidine phosphatase